VARISKSVKAGRTAKLLYLVPQTAVALEVHAAELRIAPSDVVQDLLAKHLPTVRKRKTPSKSSQVADVA
jgi:hypothetical protein